MKKNTTSLLNTGSRIPFADIFIFTIILLVSAGFLVGSLINQDDFNESSVERVGRTIVTKSSYNEQIAHQPQGKEVLFGRNLLVEQPFSEVESIAIK